MKQAFLLFAWVLMGALSAEAQNIAIGERVPELKVTTWLGGQQPATAQLTYIEFFHSSNKTSLQSLDQLKATVGKSGGKLRVLVIVQDEEQALLILKPYLSERIGVGIDSSGKTFSNFGVTYVPFGVLTDAKNRALWMGNSLQMDSALIEKISK